MSAARIGVFICKCGGEISNTIDLGSLKEHVKKIPNVVYVEEHDFLCFNEGQEALKKAIREHRLNRIVIAACSPRLHEIAFRRILSEEGVNPCMLEIVSIREQCAWPYSDNPSKATEKAKNMVKAAILRVKTLEEIGEVTVPAKLSVLVVGGGIAGCLLYTSPSPRDRG